MYQYFRGHVVKMDNDRVFQQSKGEEKENIKEIIDGFNKTFIQRELVAINDLGTLINAHLNKNVGNINNHLLNLLVRYIERLQYDVNGELVDQFYDRLTSVHSKLKIFVYDDDFNKEECQKTINDLIAIVADIYSYLKRH